MRRITLRLAGLAPAVGDCTTITHGPEDTFVVETDPSGAEVSTSKGYARKSTPWALRMDRGPEFVVTIEKTGHETAIALVSHEVGEGGAPGMAGNVLFSGLIGVAVDAGSGAVFDLVRNPLTVTLTPIENPADASVAAAGATGPRSPG